ncbi:MAG: hypothetical protein KDK24_17370, partial [Pseudooceanicola sp.]|nr:hypothetical protein [Pseudooceanicola sp.]
MRLSIALAAVLLAVLVALSGHLLLQSCGLRLPVLGVISACETDAARQRRADLAAALDQTRDLEAEIAALERELALTLCKADPPPPPPPPP